MEIGKPIKKKGYTYIPLYDSSPKARRKNAFLEAMDTRGLPKDLVEWMYNEYINVKSPVTFQTPSIKMTPGNIKTATVDGEKQYSLSLNLQIEDLNPKYIKFTNMFKVFEDYLK